MNPRCASGSSLGAPILREVTLGMSTRISVEFEMKTSLNRSKTPDSANVRKRAPATRSTSEKVNWHWADQRLDDELRDTFPASDPLTVTRNPIGE
jgi:hypothetical protein